MVYAEIELKKKVDWQTIFIKNKENRTEYAKADIPNNFNFFQQNVGDGLVPDERGANWSILQSKKSVWDRDSVENAIYF